MENESLADWFRSLGYSISETEERYLFEAFSRWARWFSESGKHLAELDESVRLGCVFPNEFDFVMNANAGVSGKDESADFGGFLMRPLLAGIVDDMPEFSIISGNDELQEPFLQLAGLSMKWLSRSFFLVNPDHINGERLHGNVSSDWPEERGQRDPEPDRPDWGCQLEYLAGLVDSASMSHLKMPFQDCLDAGQEDCPEPETGLQETVSMEIRPRDDVTSVSGGEVPVDGLPQAVSAKPYSGLKQCLNGLFPGTAGDADLSGTEPVLPEWFLPDVDTRYWFGRFMGENVHMDDIQESLVSFRQTLNARHGIDVQKLMDGLTVRKSDNTVLAAYDNPASSGQVSRLEPADADTIGRTINITVNGTGSAQETVNAISQGLSDVDLGMTLRHFKSPMMA